MPQSVYTANIKALNNRWPDLVEKLQQVDQNDLPPCQQTPSGHFTCHVIGRKNQSVYVHSRYDPLKEASRWADGALAQAAQQRDDEDGQIPMCYMVEGFGLGYHIKALFDQLEGEAFIVVSERDMPLLRTALTNIDYRQMLNSGRVIIITRTDRDEIFHKLQHHSIFMMLGVVFTRSLGQRDREFHEQIRRHLSEYAIYMRNHLISLLGNSIITCKNILFNLTDYLCGNNINMLKDHFKGCPAVVVSAGPSLAKNIDLLTKIRDKVVVIAVQTTLKILLAKGIKPDFVTSLDYHEVSKRFFQGLDEHSLDDIHLVAEPKVTWHVLDAYRGRGPISLLGNNYAHLFTAGIKDEHDHLTSGATVAHLAFYLGQYIGADPIIFIGQDLAFTNNVYYSPGNALHEVWENELNRFSTIEMKEWERIVRSRSILHKLDDINGRQIYTDQQMFTYLQQFEKDFAQSTAKVIDATEGGAAKQFCEVMTLKEAADRYCHETIDKEKFAYRQELPAYDKATTSQVRTQLQKRKEETDQLKEITTETLSLVEEMLEQVDDQPALNKNMVRLDELRAMVRQRDEIYQLVTFVSQQGQMQRFRRDRALELDSLKGKEKQRRQLQRDIPYVTEIINGCDRLSALLDESIERIDNNA